MLLQCTFTLGELDTLGENFPKRCLDKTLSQPFSCFFLRATAYAVSAHTLSQFRPSVRPSVCLSVCLSGTRVDQSKTVEVRIMQFSPHSSPIPLVFVR